jgi:hypothetical protein
LRKFEAVNAPTAAVNRKMRQIRNRPMIQPGKVRTMKLP